MLFLIAEDEYYYTDKGLNEIKKKYNINEIHVFPDKEDIMHEIKNLKQSGYCFLAPYPPSSIDARFKKNSFFDVIKLSNKFGILTTSQKKLGIPEAQVLQEKMGVTFHTPEKTFKDYTGADELLEMILLAEEKERNGLKTNGFFIAGIPGTGKSHLAQCAAGETKRILVELNLSMFMEMEDSIYELSQFFAYLIANKGRYILWIDEIEKMFVGDKSIQMLGFLLTILNNLSKTLSQSSFFFLATANNISDLAKTNPEFFRNGRFDALVFLLNPKQENATKIFKVYLENFQKKFKNETLLYIIKNSAQGILPRKNTIASKISSQVMQSSESLLELIRHTDIKDFHTLLENKDFNNLKESILKSYSFEFDIKSFMLRSVRFYGGQVSMPDRYVHTPAEIEYIIQDAYSNYYFSETIIELDKLAEKYQPLQVTMKDAIQSMLGTADKFIKI